MKTPNHFESGDVAVNNRNAIMLHDRLPELGCGTYRSVSALDENHVLKVDIMGGQGQCSSEVECWELMSPDERADFCPVVAHGKGWSVMRRADTSFSAHECAYDDGEDWCDVCDSFTHLVCQVGSEESCDCEGRCYASIFGFDPAFWMPFLERVILRYGFQDVHLGNVGLLDGRPVLIDYTH